MSPVMWQRVENAAIFATILAVTPALGYAWWWPLALFLAFDLSALGYAAGPRIGATLYNAVHSYVGPALLGAVAVISDVRWAGLVALAWAFHVALDRAIGYGLKHPDSFQHTHLGWIGKHRDQPAKEG